MLRDVRYLSGSPSLRKSFNCTYKSFLKLEIIYYSLFQCQYELSKLILTWNVVHHFLNISFQLVSYKLDCVAVTPFCILLKDELVP